MSGGHHETRGRQYTGPGVPPEHFADLRTTRPASRDHPHISEAAEENQRRFSILVAKSYYSEISVAFFGFIKKYYFSK